MMLLSYQINLTYACNLNCSKCIQFLGVLPWKNPRHITKKTLKKGAEILKEHSLHVNTVRVSGGEPTIHPKYEKCIETIASFWDYKTLLVCTNTLIEKPVKWVDRYRRSPPSWKDKQHVPWMVSPFDLGLAPKKKKRVFCEITRRCGRLFDAHGFAPCGNAGPIGRILNKDPYSVEPVIYGVDFETCKHCPSILSKPARFKMWKDVADGKYEWPTKTYREGLERELDSPTEFKTLEERLDES